MIFDSIKGDQIFKDYNMEKSNIPHWFHEKTYVHFVNCYDSVSGTVYDYAALTLEGSQLIPFKQYKGKTLLFVNVATY
ncbi:unnamed protein product [Ranitomeya imitator]|uniref:Glutathione peroxidase n=1 Tax=Ranitomeya imitator TaxID=111125 RepID=A0ABN9LRQ0_9NEOB|nr:unnamed protein product [Ranitomeya imitator]